MDFSSAYNSELFALVILPFLIFLARAIDVSLGTIRIIFVAHGQKFLAPLLGFFEVLIWLLAISQIMHNLTNPVYYIAYAAGFAIGNLIGILIEEKLAIGNAVIQIITQKETNDLIQCLNTGGYGITTIDAHGTKGDVKIIYVVIKRKDICNVTEIIKKCNPKAFYLVEEIRSASREIFPLDGSRPRKGFSKGFHLKGK